MSKLAEQHCEREVKALDDASIHELLGQLDDGWKRSADGDSIHREFRQADYGATLELVKAIAGVADEQDHHPELCFGYNRVSVVYSTHSVDGLSRNDFICAARIDALAAA